MEDYQLIKQIGSSGFSSVYSAVHKSTLEKFAIKIYTCKDDKQKEEQQSKVFQEFEIQQKLSEGNSRIVKVIEICERIKELPNNYELCIIMELCDNSLKNILDERVLSKREIKLCFTQILLAITFCHSQNIIHRDIKPHNILIKDSKVKLADFGLAAYTYKPLNKICGTPNYIAPEILRLRDPEHKPRKYTTAVDIWSLGVLLYVLFFKKPPFDDVDRELIYQRILNCQYDFPNNDNERKIPESAKNLIRHLLQINPEDRPTAKQILTHPWLQM